MKVIVTGASGLLGSSFARAATRRGHDVYAIAGSYTGALDGIGQRETIDLADFVALENFILETFPDCIVNCAAISRPDQCRQNPEASERLNVALPEKLALLSRHLFARYIHISSDQVFDGDSGPYHVGDSPNPLSIYGDQKARSEEAVLDLASEFASIVRIPLLSGNSPRGNRSVHEQLLASLSRGERPSLFTDEIRQPCSTASVASVLLELCERTDMRGILHWGGESRLSRYEIGLRIVEHFGLSASLIESTRMGGDAKFADRPQNLTMDLAPLSGRIKTQPERFDRHFDALIVPKPLQSWYHEL